MPPPVPVTYTAEIVIPNLQLTLNIDNYVNQIELIRKNYSSKIEIRTKETSFTFTTGPDSTIIAKFFLWITSDLSEPGHTKDVIVNTKDTNNIIHRTVLLKGCKIASFKLISLDSISGKSMFEIKLIYSNLVIGSLIF